MELWKLPKRMFGKIFLYNRHLIKDDISFENILLDSVLVHNTNIHTITGYKPSFLIKNDNNEVYEAVIEKIKNIYKIDIEVNNNYYNLNEFIDEQRSISKRKCY